MDNFEPSDEGCAYDTDDCDHVTVKPKWHNKDGFLFEADTCEDCQAYKWTSRIDKKYDEYLATKSLVVKFEIPIPVLRYMAATGVTPSAAIGYFLNHVWHDSELLDWVDSNYSRLYTNNQWGTKAQTTKSKIKLEPSQYRQLVGLSELTSNAVDFMTGDVIGRTVGTLMFFSSEAPYKAYRREFLNKKRSWWKVP